MKRIFLLAATAIILAISVWLIAEDTEIGPTLFTLTPGHGVHFGDAICALGAVLLLGYLYRRTHR